MTSQIPDHFKTQETRTEAARREPCSLFHVPEHFKTQTCALKQLE